MSVNLEGLKHSPLFDYYVEKGLNLTDFGGWALPIQFTSQIDEHHAVRNKVGLFETSHMGEIIVKGEEAENFLNSLITNDISKCAVNQAQYTAVVKEDGGTLDDLINYRKAEDEFMVTPNGANKEKILAWLNEHNDGQVEITDISDQVGLIPIQGPKAQAVLEKLTDTDLDSIKPFHFLDDQTVAGIDHVMISRTGYTGEDGFELYLKWEDTADLWKALLEAGEEYGIQECGLGARDTLRLEGGMCLYGQDLTEDINPLEGGIGFAVKVDKEVPFIGQDYLKAQKEGEQKRQSRGFELTGKGIAREGYKVYNKDGEEIGFVTSGTKSPTFGKAIGYMIVDKGATEFGDEVLIQVRKKQVPALVCKKDWLRR
ncbi:glycine cleavage system aminomethyltransferase GcvT [Aerococcus sanguinicola]|uniref:Aminomethyltransferase n=1 Tax=Aerococcus sanguinicola TaxID=119206 RepID=A0A120I943_9LACT|nr:MULTISPECIES: glycine cleavage system aminomethyltransferase GcvT [Aerococcus]AMB93760.1 glycine cleavage system protein T [Aerococcus sanguinicola]OFT94774.1 glycine cleavage system protein T [Aerococcus sp. HMSC23C02]PKZ21510.1 glycine cleavage system protein T [Aerococcus sanguinicola]